VDRKFDFGVIRKLRKAKKLTLEKLAKQAGIAYATLAKLEVNKVNPTVETVEKIAHVLGISAGNLLTLAENLIAEKKEREDFTVDGMSGCKVQFRDITLKVLDASKGQVLSTPGTHEEDYEVCFVIEGRMRVNLHDKQYELGAGEALRYDAVFNHSIEALENSRYILVHLPKDKVR